MTAKEVEKYGRELELRPDLDEVKLKVMYDVVFDKFDRNVELRRKLLDTGDLVLVEDNYWKDKYWGCLRRKGRESSWYYINASAGQNERNVLENLI